MLALIVSVLAAAAPQPTIVQKPIPFPKARKEQMAAYSRRHYDIDSYRLRDPKVIVAGGEESLEIGRGAIARLELAPHRSRGGDADLLADNRSKQGDCSCIAYPRLRLAMPLEHASESGLDCGKRLQALVESFRGPDHQAMLAA